MTPTSACACSDPGHRATSSGKVVAHGRCGTCDRRWRRRQAGALPTRRRPGHQSCTVQISIVHHARLAGLALERGTSVAAEADASIELGLSQTRTVEHQHSTRNQP